MLSRHVIHRTLAARLDSRCPPAAGDVRWAVRTGTGQLELGHREPPTHRHHLAVPRRVRGLLPPSSTREQRSRHAERTPITNEHGVCPGEIVCLGERGLAPCNARTPSAESCNALDDDCDGVTDEDPCDDGNPCTVNDRCAAGSCKPGSFNYCDDGNPCTYDECNVDYGGCRFDPLPMDTAPCHMGGGLACPHGECTTGVCTPKPGASCSVEIDYDSCQDVTVEGKCSADGICEPETDVPDECGDCEGWCIQCDTPICVPPADFF